MMPYKCKYGARCEHPQRITLEFDPVTGCRLRIYSNGTKRCNHCDAFFRVDGARCPCCHVILRTHGKNNEARKRDLEVMPRIV